MLRHNLSIALRNLKRHPGYAVINIAGLAIGITCCLLILIQVRNELSYDRYHEHADRIVRLVKGSNSNTPELWSPAIQQELPDVEQSVRLMGGFSRALVFDGESSRREPNGLYADAAVFNVFSWPLSRGSAERALADPYTVVVTPNMAERYFGETDPVGQILTIGGISNDPSRRDYVVTGIVEEVPQQSHVRFDYLISMKTVEVLNENGEWGTPLSWTNRMAKTYVLLKPNVPPGRFLARIPDFLRRHIDDDRYDFDDAAIQPIASIHLRSNLRNEFEPGGTIRYVYLFSALALFILLLACINFVNLATARSQQRAMEIGLRKAIGAHRSQLVWQFLAESFVLALLSLPVSLVCLMLAAPVYNSISGASVSAIDLADVPVLAGIALLLGLVALGAGSYPALVLSAMRPVRAIKGEAASGRSGVRLRQGLVVFQFSVSVVLIIGTAVVFNQLRFVQHKDLGFHSEQVVVVPIGHAESVGDRADIFKREVASLPGVVKVTASHSIPSQFVNQFGYRREGAPDEDQLGLGDMSVDHDFIEAFGIELVAGRSFDANLASDSTAFVLNESAAAELGWQAAAAIGNRITWDFPAGFTGPVIGVVRDFNVGSLHSAIPPMVFHITRFGSNFVAARIAPTQIAATLSGIEQTWKRFEPNIPIEYFFVDDQFAQFYESEARLAKTFAIGAGLAVVIACLGLVGLATLLSERRRKEIGVRKVLGASTFGIVTLLSREFLTLVVLGFLIAAPVAFVAMSRWLETFAYRVTIGPGVFAFAGGVALVVAMATVSYQAVRAAAADPVRSLRYE